MVPHEDVAIQTMGVASGLIMSVGDPIIVIGSAHFVWISILQQPANANNKDGGMVLENARLTLLARKVRVHLENVFSVEELKLLRKIGIAKIFELREK